MLRTPIASLLIAGSLGAQVTSRASLSSTGTQGNDTSRAGALSADGRFVAFSSLASNLVAGDTNATFDAFVRDRVQGTTERVSVSSAGLQGNGESLPCSLSTDGRCVVIVSWATNLVAGDSNQFGDVFVRDRQAGTTERVSVASTGLQGNGYCTAAACSADARYVAFGSFASNLVAGDTNGTLDVFVRDRQAGTTERISVDSNGLQGNDVSELGAISADGRHVAFFSNATNLVPGDTNLQFDVFVHDRQTGATERVSVASTGAQGNDISFPCSISSDGRLVAFASWASTLVPGDTNQAQDIFVRDRLASTTVRVSVDSTGAQADERSWEPAISSDGRSVAFSSSASNLVAGDSNLSQDVFLHELQTGATLRVSVDTSGQEADFQSRFPALSPDGRYVAFSSSATNLVPGDSNGREDAFVHDLLAAGFASLCDPGSAGVIACPCANPPAGAGRGCDNSAATGGASIAASGIAYLALDSLVFTTSGERPTATSILLQGTSPIATGVAFGQGVRCAGGTLKRMYSKIAVAGSITAPDFGAGDPTVSARSAQLGDPILPGETRWYLVYYRDPLVSGSCTATSTFNSTQTGSVAWWP